MNKIRNETIWNKNGNEERQVTGNERTAMKMERQCRDNGGLQKLLVRLQNETHRGTVGTAEQPTHGRMGLGTACKEEISRMQKISIDGSEGEGGIFGLRKTAFTEKIPLIIPKCRYDLR
jgi:hypothetical protein